MPHDSTRSRMIHHVRRLLLVGAMILLVVAGLRPSTAVLAACGGTTTVNNHIQLNNAIDEFNGLEGVDCDFTIAFGQDIKAESPTIPVSSFSQDVHLIIDGMGHEFDMDHWLQSALYFMDVESAEIRNLTITNGLGVGVLSDYSNLTIRNSTVMNTIPAGVDFDETTAGVAAGVGNLVVIDSSIILNAGEGIYAEDTSDPYEVVIINSTIANNHDDGIEVNFVNNLRLYNSTIAGNGDEGVDLYVTHASIYNSILSGNLVDCRNDGYSIEVYNTLITKDDTDDPCINDDDPDLGNIVGEDPLLGFLGDNQGPTWTMPLLELTGDVTAVSPAIDAGDNDYLTLDLFGEDYTINYDQRGAPFDRADPTTADMGAYEGSQELVCEFPFDVSEEADLHDAILCFNHSTDGDPHIVELLNSITLTRPLPIIENNVGNGRLEIKGNEFKLDGGFEWGTGMRIVGSQVVIEELRITSMNGIGIEVLSESDLTVIRSSVDANIGGIFSEESDVEIRDSAIYYNATSGVVALGYLPDTSFSLINSTVYHNFDTDYGDPAVLAEEINTTILNSTIAENWGDGLVLYDGLVDSEFSYHITNSIFASNDSYDCEEWIENADVVFENNLIEGASGCNAPTEDGNILDEDPLFGTFGDYGGPTPTLPILSVTGTVTEASPALDAGANTPASSYPLTYDQRGPDHSRFINDVVDMGAFEGPHSIHCETPYTVENEQDWNDAIFCFNHHPANEFVIEVEEGFSLTAMPESMDNPTEGVFLTVYGNSNVIDAQDTFFIGLLDVVYDTVVTIHDLTLTRGGGFPDFNGFVAGGVVNEGDLTFRNSTISESQSYYGGGIVNLDYGVLYLNDSFVLDNTASSSQEAMGGGIFNVGEMEIERTLVSGNKAISYLFAGGGAITNVGTLIVDDSTISDNEAQGGYFFAAGGGILNDSELTITGSTISNNEAGSLALASGGGIHSGSLGIVRQRNGSITALQSEYGLVDFSVEFGAGHSHSSAHSPLARFLRQDAVGLADHVSRLGSSDGLRAADEASDMLLFILNSTISGNSVEGGYVAAGGGVSVEDTCCGSEGTADAVFLYTTIADNSLVSYDPEFLTDFYGGGIYIDGNANPNFDAYIANSILALNRVAGQPGMDCTLEWYDEIAFEALNSLFGSTGEGACDVGDLNGNLIGEDPLLGELDDNGGPTKTHALPFNSPAVDVASHGWFTDLELGFDLVYDQRGEFFERIYNGSPDMGAYEYQPGESTDPCPAVDGNVIANFCFEDGSAPWTFHSDGHGVYNVSPFEPYAGLGAAEIKITVPGSNVQFYQSGITLQGDTTYELTFAAKSSDGRNLSVFVHKHGANYASYGLSNEVFDLTADWQEFSVEFTTPNFGSVNDARLRFWLAPFDAKGTVYSIDRVVLRPAGGPELPPPPPPPDPEVPPQGECTATPGNLIANPGYEDGTFGWLFFTNGSANFTAPETGSDAYECTHNARVKINTSGNNVQLFQTGIELEPNTHYRLRLAAKATGANAVQLFVQRHSAPHSNYGLNGLKLDLTSDWQVFVVDFTTSGFASTTTDTRLRLWLAPYDTAGAVFEFDDVVLTPVDETPVRATDGAATRARATTADAYLVSGYFIDNNHTDRLGGGYVGVLDGCRNARASVSRLWPANNKLWPVSIGNIGTPQSVAITGVWQDEPVGFEPDAVIGTGGALHLRAERDLDAGADGRVYTIQFRATYANGQSCNGIVTVGVPLSNRRGVEARSGGDLFVSTDK